MNVVKLIFVDVIVEIFIWNGWGCWLEDLFKFVVKIKVSRV